MRPPVIVTKCQNFLGCTTGTESLKDVFNVSFGGLTYFMEGIRKAYYGNKDESAGPCTRETME